MVHAIMKAATLLLCLLLLLLSVDVASAVVVDEDSGSPTTLEDTNAENAAQNTGESDRAAADAAANKDRDNFDAKDHTDWGTYYDPKNIFCGQYDCYKILGFDYENYGREKPSTKVITKRYRALSREWHPDKSKHKDAKERFVVRTHRLLLVESAGGGVLRWQNSPTVYVVNKTYINHQTFEQLICLHPYGSSSPLYQCPILCHIHTHTLSHCFLHVFVLYLSHRKLLGPMKS